MMVLLKLLVSKLFLIGLPIRLSRGLFFFFCFFFLFFFFFVFFFFWFLFFGFWFLVCFFGLFLFCYFFPHIFLNSAGHEVPRLQPAPGLQMVSDFLDEIKKN